MAGQERGLSETKRACLRLAAEGKTSKEIAQALGLSPSTVDTYVRAAIGFFGVRNRIQAANALAALEDEPPLSILRSQPEPVAEPPKPVVDIRYPVPGGGAAAEGLRDAVLTYQADLTFPEPSADATREITKSRDPIGTLLQIAAISAAIVVIGSAAEPIGRGFESLASLILHLRQN